MKSYLIKTIGIIMVASLAGVTHFALGEKIRFVDISATTNTIPLGSGDTAETTAPPPPTSDVAPATPVDEMPIGEGNQEVLVLEREITTEQAKILFDRGLAQFLDARPKAEFEEGHILGANHLAPSSFESGTPVIVDFLDENMLVVVYCSGGDCIDSHIVTEDLSLIRPELANIIHIYTDGYSAWTDAGLATDIGPDPLAE